ncbi:hypothetical protein L208DRAFT_1396809 [Tricholoma matsutake]|nr:hypothetical protein L208DRAFT_1396809 [Tricholoma matsutake 945]
MLYITWYRTISQVVYEYACAGAGVDARMGGNVDMGFRAMAGIGTGAEEVAERWRDGDTSRSRHMGIWEMGMGGGTGIKLQLPLS